MNDVTDQSSLPAALEDRVMTSDCKIATLQVRPESHPALRRSQRLDGLRVAVIGGGHIGSALGLALQANRADTTIFTQFSAAALRTGRILSSQCIWGTASRIEETWAPTPWKGEYAGIGGFQVRLLSPHASAPECDVLASLNEPGNSVDQRLKVSLWLDTFEARGGNLVIGEISRSQVEDIGQSYDLVIVSAGKFRGDLADLFPRDDQRSRYSQTQRVGAVVYVQGRQQELSTGSDAAFEEWSVVPGVGDFFAIPAYAHCGPCHIVCMQGFVGSPLDRFSNVRSPDEILALTRSIFEQCLPWERGRWRDAKLIDKNAAICGGFPPVVRKPVAHLSNGKRVMAFGDAHILLDPLTAQGANSHLKSFDLLLERIARADGAFTGEWMHDTAEMIWAKVAKVEAVLEQYLNPRAHLWDVFRAAHRDQEFRQWWINSHFDRPADLAPWIESPQGTRRFLNERRPESRVG